MTNFDPTSYLMGQKAAGGGGGGSSTLSGLTDVDISNPTNGQTLVYNATSGKWENGESDGGFLVCKINEDTLALNHTWQEIANGPYAILRIDPSEPGGQIDFGLLMTCGGPADNIYYVEFMTLGGTLSFETNSTSGYPVFVEQG